MQDEKESSKKEEKPKEEKKEGEGEGEKKEDDKKDDASTKNRPYPEVSGSLEIKDQTEWVP